jgi:hypothetical protein
MTFTIHPYQLEDGTWVFDDPDRGLKQEPFVLGMSEMLTELAARLSLSDSPGDPPRKVLEVTFAADEASDSDTRPSAKLDWLLSQNGGNWYRGTIYAPNFGCVQMIGWLCPALFKYFNRAPTTIYVHAC